MRSPNVMCLLLLGLAPGACRTATTESSTNTQDAIVTRTLAVRAWEVWDRSGCLGSVVRYEDLADPARAFYAVRNPDQQDLGIVDLEGRAWRYLPHQRDPDWLGTGTVLQGTTRILGGDASCKLREVPVESLSRRSAAAPVR